MPPKKKFSRELLIDIAFKRVRRRGWKGLTARYLAERTGTSSRPIYTHFKSMKDLEEEVVIKALEVLERYMREKRTDDPWLDHGLGYVWFALEERMLFRCINDEDHVQIQRKHAISLWDSLTESLKDYPPFAGLSPELIYRIQLSRWLFAHGLAFWINNAPFDYKDRSEVADLIRDVEESLLEGLKKIAAKKIKEDAMTSREPSAMAFEIAGGRAYEWSLPEGDRVCSDPYAFLFLPPEEVKAFEKDPDRGRKGFEMIETMMPGVNGALMTRVRFFDDTLENMLEQGLEQLVLLGAGFDTRAHRFEAVREKGVRVFELDHPPTQNYKKMKVEEIFGGLPPYISYIPLDLIGDDLASSLTGAGYDPGLKTLFILEGLSMYLPTGTVEAIMSFIPANSGPGSAVLFDYFHPEVIAGGSDLKEAQNLRHFVTQRGAPLQFGVGSDEIESFLQARGFKRVESYSAPHFKNNYFKNNSTGRTVSPMFNLAYAVTGA